MPSGRSQDEPDARTPHPTKLVSQQDLETVDVATQCGEPAVDPTNRLVLTACWCRTLPAEGTLDPPPESEAYPVGRMWPFGGARFDDDLSLSRTHFQLGREEDEALWLEVCSPRGVKVGGVLYSEGERVDLERNDLVRAGAVLFVVHRKPPAEAGTGRRDRLRRIFVGLSSHSVALRNEIREVAELEATVFIVGETGTGKELIATGIHESSSRAGGTPVSVNCAELANPQLAASVLFGHVKGAFTGATQNHRGYFERAGKGTVFLDEIGELPKEVQGMLLRVLEARKFSRLGDEKVREMEARVVSATNRDLKQMVEDGEFRRDVYARLAQHVIPVKPLRDRIVDVPPIAARLLASIHGAGDLRLGCDDVERLCLARLPENARGIRNMLQRAVVKRAGAGSSQLELLDDQREELEREHEQLEVERDEQPVAALPPPPAQAPAWTPGVAPVAPWPPPAPAPPPKARKKPKRRPGHLPFDTVEELAAHFAAHEWNATQAMNALDVPVNYLYRSWLPWFEVESLDALRERFGSG